MASVTLVDARDCRRYPATENLGLASLAAALRRAGHQVALRVHDTSGDGDAAGPAWWAGQTAVGFTLFHCNVSAVFALCRRIRATSPDTGVFIGGPFATVVAEPALRDCPQLDGVVLGDGERALADWLAARQCAADGHAVAAIAGLFTRQHRVATPVAEPSVEERPARDFAFSSGRPAAVARLSGKRGCSGTCGFCVIGSSRQRQLKEVRLRSPESLVAEARELADRYRVRAFMLHDCPFDELGPQGPQRLARLCELVQQEPEPLAFECQLEGNRLGEVGASLFPALRAAGFSQVMVLLGSGNPHDRARLGKRGALGALEATIAALRQHDIEVVFEFFMLEPWSTPESFRENLALLERHAAYRLAYFVKRVPVYRGTALWTDAHAAGLLPDPDAYQRPDDYDFADPAMTGVARVWARLEASPIMQLDRDLQDVVYLYDWMRVLFPRELAPLAPMVAALKSEAAGQLSALFADARAGSLEVPTPEALTGALAPIYGKAKQVQMSLLRCAPVRGYLLRALPDAAVAAAGRAR